jgi:shikimate kinase
LTIKDIFLNKGEDYFRQMEHEILTNYVFNYSTIVATGGGTPCYYNNNNFMNHTGFTIYLKVSCEELVRRLKDNHQRPLILENKYNLYDFVSLQIKEREQYYCKSKLTFESDCASTDQLCTLLKKNYEQFEYRFKK